MNVYKVQSKSGACTESIGRGT